jgi:hypothetical protein
MPRRAGNRLAWDPGRGERIRTSGLYVPNVALYQAKLHPVPVTAETPSGPALQQLRSQLLQSITVYVLRQLLQGI